MLENTLDKDIMIKQEAGSSVYLSENMCMDGWPFWQSSYRDGEIITVETKPEGYDIEIHRVSQKNLPTFKMKKLCKYEAEKLSLDVFGMLKCIEVFSYNKYLNLS